MAAKKNRLVVVRTYSAGVHVGTLVKRKGREVTLRAARRCWYWTGAFTLNALATKGCGPGSKISAPVCEIVLTEAIEILACDPAAMAQIATYEYTP